METQGKYETEIDIKDMLIYCFLHWRSAIIFSLIFGLIIGLFQGYKSYSKALVSNAAAERALAEESLTAADLDTISVESHTDLKNAVGHDIKIARLNDNVITIWTSIQTQEKYINESPLMQLDAGNVSKSVSDVMISGNITTNALTILLSEYQNELLNGSYVVSSADSFGMTEADIRELIEVNISSVGFSDYNSSNGTPDDVFGLFSITAIGKDPEMSEKILKSLTDSLSSINDKIKASTGINHAISLVSTNTISVADKEIKDFQDTQKSKLDSLYTKFDQAQDALTKTLDATGDTSAEKYLQGNITNKTSTIAIVSPSKTAAKDFLKWAVMGFIVFFLIYGVILCIVYVVGRPKTVSALTCRFPVRILGSIRDASSRLYKGNTIFDRWLRKCAGISPERNEKEALEMTASNLTVYCSDEKRFIIAGADSPEHRNALCETLSDLMPDKSFSAPSDILRDPVSRDMLKGCDAIIFSEVYGRSATRDLYDELSLLSGTDIKIAGMFTQ